MRFALGILLFLIGTSALPEGYVRIEYPCRMVCCLGVGRFPDNADGLLLWILLPVTDYLFVFGVVVLRLEMVFVVRRPIVHDFGNQHGRSMAEL